MRVHQSALWLPILWMLAGTVHAADPPEQVVREYMTALQTQGMSAAPRFIHPDELARFKEALMPLIRREAGGKQDTFTAALFGKDATVAEVEAVSPADFMGALMKFAGEKLKGIEFTSLDILGSVREKDVVHVVARIGVEATKGIKIRQMQVISVKPYQNGWKLMLTGELEGMAAALAAQ